MLSYSTRHLLVMAWLPVDSTAALRGILDAARPGSGLSLRLAPSTFLLGGLPLNVTGFNLTIAGDAATTILDGEGLSRLVSVSSGGWLKLSNLTLTGGNTSYYGGAVFASGSGTGVQLSDDRVSHCNASYGGGLAITTGATLLLTGCTVHSC